MASRLTPEMFSAALTVCCSQGGCEENTLGGCSIDTDQELQRQVEHLEQVQGEHLLLNLWWQRQYWSREIRQDKIILYYTTSTLLRAAVALTLCIWTRSVFDSRLSCLKLRHSWIKDAPRPYAQCTLYSQAKLHANHMTTQWHSAPVHSKNVFSFCYLVCKISKRSFYFDVCAVNNSQDMWHNSSTINSVTPGSIHSILM